MADRDRDDRDLEDLEDREKRDQRRFAETKGWPRQRMKGKGAGKEKGSSEAVIEVETIPFEIRYVNLRKDHYWFERLK